MVVAGPGPSRAAGKIGQAPSLNHPLAVPRHNYLTQEHGGPAY